MSMSVKSFLHSIKKQETTVKKLIKKKLIEHWQEGHTYLFGFNSILKDFDEIEKDFLINQDPYSSLRRDYQSRGSVFNESNQYKVISAIIKPKFDRILINDNYPFTEFLKELAIVESNQEVIKLFVNNSQIYELMYELNSFDDFQILNYNECIEDTEIFKRLHHKVFGDKIDITLNEDFNFQLKPLYRTHFKLLYSEFTDHYVDEKRTSLDDFVNVFTKNTIDHDSKIYFFCNNGLACYLLDQLRKEIFSNLTQKNMSRSKRFISSGDTLFSQSTLSVSKKSVSEDEQNTVARTIVRIKKHEQR